MVLIIKALTPNIVIEKIKNTNITIIMLTIGKVDCSTLQTICDNGDNPLSQMIDIGKSDRIAQTFKKIGDMIVGQSIMETF